MAGIEALLALRSHLGGSVHIELLAPEPEFIYRPTAVAEPFGLGEVHRLELAKIASDHQAAFRLDSLAAVEPDASVAVTGSGERLDYDYLLVAVGASLRAGIDGAITFGGPADRDAFERLLADARAGSVERISFVAPDAVAWLLPLYELALLTSWWARKQKLPLSLSLQTPESRPLEAFGAKASSVVGRLMHEAEIEFVRAGSFTPRADAVVSIPVCAGPFVEGLPSDGEGFIPTDRLGAVEGFENVYAAGDGTSFPIKQGGLAAQQADAAAAAIAGALGASTPPEPFSPVLRGLLLTGDLPRYLRQTGEVSETGVGPLWWPPAKIAAQFLAPYLANASIAPTTLSDRGAPDELESSEQLAADEHDAIDLLLELADANARRGSFSFALRCFDAAEDLAGPLPAERQADRQAWLSKVRAARAGTR